MLQELMLKTGDEIASLSEEQLDIYVNDCSVRILEKIDASDKKIKDAQKEAKNASEMETGIFGKTAKKTTAVSNGLVTTNEAVSEMNDLLQEIIHFICLTLRFAQKMYESIEYMIEDGFTGRDGQFHSLTEDSKKIARRVLEESSRYARSQLEIDLKNREQDNKIDDIAEKLSDKDRIDAEQSHRLEELRTLLNDKKTIDQNQEESIKENSDAIKIVFDYMKQKDEIDKAQQTDINKIKNDSTKKNILTVVFSSISLIISFTVLIIQVFF